MCERNHSSQRSDLTGCHGSCIWLISAGVVSKPRGGFRAAKAIGEVDSDNDWIIVMLMMEGR